MSPMQVSLKGNLFHLHLPHGVPEPASGIKDTKVAGATDLGYHIFYGSHIARGAPDGFIKVTGVQA